MNTDRKNERFSCVVPVDSQKKGLFDSIETIDLSKGGLGFISPKKIPLDTEIAIELDLSETGDSAIVIGKVTWVTPITNSNNYRIGLSFVNILHGSRSRLNKYFQTLNETI